MMVPKRLKLNIRGIWVGFTGSLAIAWGISAYSWELIDRLEHRKVIIQRSSFFSILAGLSGTGGPGRFYTNG